MFAMPASADVKLTGFSRILPTISNYVGNGNGSYQSPGSLTNALTDSTRSFTEMRNRLRFEVGDENVKGVYFFEVDGTWGDTGGQIGRNQGFASNGDSINIETKNAYLWFKVPNTPVSFTAGLQGYTDEFAGLMFSASDQAGVVANFKLDPVSVRLTWLKIRDDVADSDNNANIFKWAGENAGSNEADYYAIDAKFSPTKIITATGHIGFIRDSGSFVAKPTEVTAFDTMKSYYVGANATLNLAPVTLSAFALYNFGTIEQIGAAGDVDISGYAARIRADANIGPGKAFFEALYVSGDDDTADDEYNSVVTGSDYALLTSFYTSPDLWILFPNASMINNATALVLNPSNSGRGVMLVAAGFSMKFSNTLSGKIGAGYLRAAESRATSNDDDMGTEVNANLTYNITKGLDFGVYGAYAFLGGFYDQTVSANDPDNLYTVFGRLNYAF
jgi:hypothetical protein